MIRILHLPIKLILLTIVTSTVSFGLIKGIRNVGQKTVALVTTPVQKGVVTVALNNCKLVKSILGVTANQLASSGPPDVNQLTIDLWYGNNKEVYNVTNLVPKLAYSRNFDNHKPVVIFVHGFLSSSESAAAMQVTRSLVNKGGLNVLALDSSKLIRFLYLRSSSSVQFIGKALGNILVDLSRWGIHRNNIHIVGHSLGSHIAGFAGKMFQNATGYRIARISALDPAGPCFFQKSTDFRLHSTDADFVDVIHSDSGVFGIGTDVGTVDFYPNGGGVQPGCALPPCSHSRAWELFSESVLNPKDFPAVKCDTWSNFISGRCDRNHMTYMGYGADTHANGSYYLQTKGEYPFGLGNPRYISNRTSTLWRLLGY